MGSPSLSANSSIIFASLPSTSLFRALGAPTFSVYYNVDFLRSSFSAAFFKLIFFLLHLFNSQHQVFFATISITPFLILFLDISAKQSVTQLLDYKNTRSARLYRNKDTATTRKYHPNIYITQLIIYLSFYIRQHLRKNK